MKTAILVVSFGTTHRDALERDIETIENAIRAKVTPLPVYRAFTSKRVIASLKKEGLVVLEPLEALRKLADEGYSRIVIQPLHVIPGFEFDKLQRAVRIAAHDKGLELVLGRPLLSHHEDYQEFIEAVEETIASELTSEGLLWMGHGTEHAANACYVYLERLWQDTRKNVHVVNLEGYPMCQHIMPTLKAKYKRIDLLPLLIVAGDHAKNDMAGDKDSLKVELEEEGIRVNPILRGLGSYRSITDLFAKRVTSLIEGAVTTKKEEA